MWSGNSLDLEERRVLSRTADAESTVFIAHNALGSGVCAGRGSGARYSEAAG